MRLRRLLTIAIAFGLLAGAAVGIAARPGDEGGAYLVRAVFDNGSFVIPGEDVKVAGVKVGQIHDVALTRDRKAAVVLAIEDPAFRPFHRDAHCQIRLQSLIGEQFVDCEPTRPRADGGPPAPALEPIAEGRPGEGEHLLPVGNNTTPVAVDLLNNIARKPQRERLRLIVNELGAGLAGNGTRLRAALRRANPALRETEKVVAVLADQNRLLGRLVDESDRVLAPLAERRRELTGFVDHAGAVAAASAERGEDLEANFAKFPGFLRELRPTADRFSGLADQMNPALASLAGQAPAINESVERLAPFSDLARPALITLGGTARAGERIFPAIRPLVDDVRGLARPLRPVARDLAELTGSFDRAGGVENLMRLIYFIAGATNGVDEFGHYIRTGLNLGACSQRTSSLTAFGCESDFDQTSENPTASGAAAARAAIPPEDPGAVRRDAERYGFEPDQDEALLDYLLGHEGTEGAVGTEERAP